MGAKATAAVNGIGAASDTSWGWWLLAGARAATYTFTGSAIADAVAAPPPLVIGPAAKFGPGVNPTAIQFTPLALSATGARGSTAAANMAGSSNVGLAFFGCNVAVTAIAAAAPGGGTASASADARDPWEVTFQHRPGRKSYVVASVTPDFSLEPARGTSGVRLYGSFGEIALSLDGTKNKPKASVKLEPGWRVYDDVVFPRVASYFKRPKRLLSKQRLERLFLRQHSKKVPLWLWTVPPPTLTFVKEVPVSVASEQIEIGIAVSDADATDERDRGRRRE